MSAHASARPVNGFRCIACAGGPFSDRAALEAHWAEFNHAPASMQSYALRRARAVITGEVIPLSITPVNFDPAE